MHQAHVEFSTLAYNLDRGATTWYSTMEYPHGNQAKKVNLWTFKPMTKEHQANVVFSTLAYNLDRGKASWYCISILKGIK